MSKRAPSGEVTVTHPTRRSARCSKKKPAAARAPLPPPPPSNGQDGDVEVEAVEDKELYGNPQYSIESIHAVMQNRPIAASATPPPPVPSIAAPSPLKDVTSASLIIEALRTRVAELEAGNSGGVRCIVCHGALVQPVVSIVCWHVACEVCFLTALGTRGLCPHCTSIMMPTDLRRIYF